MVASLIGPPAPSPAAFASNAARLGSSQRQDLALAVLAGQQPVRQLAAQHGVSPQFCYQQARKAQEALSQAFHPVLAEQPVLFYLPVTAAWIQQLALELMLVGHASDRAVQEILGDCLDWPAPCLGSLHNLLRQTAEKAAALNARQELSPIRVGAFDEIFQAHRPVLVGLDVVSSYCFLLASESHYDETTWGVHLLELQQQGLKLDYSVADSGKAFRAGQHAAWGDLPCHGDVFHAQRLINEVAGFLEHRAAGCQEACQKLERQIAHLQSDARRDVPRQLQQRWRRLLAAAQQQQQAQSLAQDVGVLAEWMNQDVLSLAGEELAVRQELYDFIVGQLQRREGLCPHRLSPLRRALQGQRQQLLAFAGRLDEQLAELAERWQVPRPWVRAVCLLQRENPSQRRYWQRRAELAGKLGQRFYPLEEAVKQTLAATVRCSSLVENLNSRLRGYFFLRRQVGGPYLELLRFVLNHRRYRRSRCPGRVGRSPAQLLSGQEHPHWLEMLGYRLFRRPPSLAA